MRILARSRWLKLALLVVAAGSPERMVKAAPLDEGHVGGLGFEGPTVGNVTSVYWNPAALGLIKGVQVFVAGTVRRTTTTVERAPIDPSTGQPGGARSFPATSSTDLTQPLQWPPGPGGFFGIASDLGGDRFTLAFASYAPYVERSSFRATASGEEPTRYHRVSADLRNIALVPALAIRISGDLRIGFAPGFLFSSGRMRFDVDTAPYQPACAGGTCGAEDPALAARYDLGSGLSIMDSKLTVTIAGGVYYRLGDVELGLSYSSRPLGNGGGRVQIAANDSQITLPGGQTLCAASAGAPSGITPRCVMGDITYALPDTFVAGVSWRRSPRLRLHATVRLQTYSLHDRIYIRVIGTPSGPSSLAASSLPESVTIYRGFQNAWDLRLGAELWATTRLRVGLTGRIQTSAVPSANVTASAVDGLQLEPIAVAQLHIMPHVWLGAGYGFIWMPSVNAHPSPFNAGAIAACQASGGDLSTPACQARQQGLGMPTAEGTYRQYAHELSASVTAQF